MVARPELRNKRPNLTQRRSLYACTAVTSSREFRVRFWRTIIRFIVGDDNVDTVYALSGIPNRRFLP